MSGIRDWGEEGATPEELALLSASRSEEAPSAARTRTLAALGLGTAITATTIASTTTAAATTASTGAGLGAAAKIGIALVIAAGFGGGFAWNAARKAPPISAVERPPVLAPVVSVAQPPAAPTAQTASDDALAEAPEPAVPAPAALPIGKPRPQASASASTLPEEVAALEKAHAALAAHRPDAAQKALDRYRAQFPNGALRSEEKVLRVQVALARGDKTGAGAMADELRKDHPDSPFVRPVDDLVTQEKPARPGKP